MAYPLSAPFAGQFTVTQGYGPTNNTAEFAGHGYPPPGQSLPLWHSGIDYATPGGTQLYAMADGEVQHAGLDEYAAQFNGSYGLVLRIAYDNGYFSLYAHQSSIAVSQGDRVARGQAVSQTGGGPPQGPNTNSGNSDGPHLHLEVRKNGGGPGSDIDPLGVIDFGAQAAQNAPAPPPVASQAGSGTTTSTAPPVDRTQLPVEPATLLKRVRPYASSLSSVDTGRPNPIMACEIASQIVPVLSAQDVTLTTYRTAGSFSVDLSLNLLGRVQQGKLLDEITTRRRTQVILYAAFVADVRAAGAGDLLPIFTGFAETPHFSYHGPSRTLSLSGPDLSGLLSSPSATESNLQQFQNVDASAVARTLAARHNLDADVDAATGKVGSFFDGSFLQTRQQGQTEWDILTQLATQQGFVCYVDGTTLRFGRLPSPLPPTVELRYEVAGEQAGPVLSLEIDAQPHSQRDYAIVVQSYDTKTKQTASSRAGTDQSSSGGSFSSLFGVGAGNQDSLQVITVTRPPNTPQSRLDTEARSLLAIYQSTEYLMRAQIRGALPIYRYSPLAIVSDTVYRAFQGARQLYYPAQISYTYDPSSGMMMTLVAGNRPYGVESSDAPSGGVLGG